MLKKFICCILVISFFGSQLNGFIIFLNFKANQDFIAKELCEDKDIPTSTCQGNCYLAKQLKAEKEKEEEKAPPETKEKNEVIFYVDAKSLSLNTHLFSAQQAKYSSGQNVPLKDFIEDIFRPPLFS